MKQLIILLGFFSITTLGYGQVELSKLALDVGVQKHSTQGLGLKIGATYFLSEKSEIYAFTTLQPTSIAQKYEGSIGYRRQVIKLNKFSAHLGIELGGYSHQYNISVLENYSSTGLFASLPIMMRYQLTDRIALEADIKSGRGIRQSGAGRRNYYFSSASIGMKYRFGKKSTK